MSERPGARGLLKAVGLAALVLSFLSCVSAQGNSHIYVDEATGSDSNPGTQSRPLKTISKAAGMAVANHERNISTRISVDPGVYRESIGLSGRSAESGAPISIEAVKPGSVIISGSDVWTRWKPEPENPGRYEHAWPFHWGTCAAPPHWPKLAPLATRREMVFVNGVLLEQVLATEQMHQGTFFVDESASRIVIWPVAGVDPGSMTVEVSVRPALFTSRLISNLSLNGLIFEEANSCLSTNPKAAVWIVHASSERIENCIFRWNNWIGLSVSGINDSLLLHDVASHNGELGMAGYGLNDITVEDADTSYNNWRGNWGQFYDWEPAGGKFLHVHGGVFKGYRATGNEAHGLWFDTGNQNIRIEGAFLRENRLNGLFIEANQGPITIANSRICSNRGGGIESDNSANVTIANNLIANNGGYQIFVDGASPQRTWKNSQTGVTSTATENGWSISHNTLAGNDASQILFKTYQSSPDSSRLFFSTLQSNDNNWYNSSRPPILQLDRGGVGHKPVNLDLAAWQTATGQDNNSKSSPPSQDAPLHCPNR